LIFYLTLTALAKKFCDLLFVLSRRFCWQTVECMFFSTCNGPTNALVCNKTLIQMSHIKTLKITPTCFYHHLINIRELFDPS
jgi:hypothetical protein